MSEIHLESDAPAKDPSFGWRQLAEALAEILAEPNQDAIVLGIHGPWGSGKSTLMNAIEDRLRVVFGPKAIFISFNAWKYQDREALWRALILRILDNLRGELESLAPEKRIAKAREITELERSLYASFTTQEKGALKVNWAGLAIETVLTIMRLTTGGVVGGVIGKAGQALRRFFDGKGNDGSDGDAAASIQRASDILHREVVERNVEQVNAIDQFLDRYQRLIGDLGDGGKRIFVMIDDLDRCLPDEALSIFEAIKLFLDAPQCRYVVAIDRSMIRRGLALRYDRAPETVDPDEYIEKTISLSFDLPALAPDQAAALLDAAGLSTVDAAARKQGELDPWHQAIISALGTNPRRLKRVANTLRVTRALAGKTGKTFTEADGKLLLKLGLIAYRNSWVYDLMRRDEKLASRLQEIGTRSGNSSAIPSATDLPEHLSGLVNDTGFWQLMRLPPSLNEVLMRKGAAWFQQAVGDEPADRA